VTPDTPLKRVAGILAAHGFSGLPVVGPAGEPLGVVSEADFLVKGTEPALEPRRTLGRRLRFRRGDAESKAKRSARTAGEAMSAPAISITPERPVAEAARLMMENQVKRLPVVDDEGRLVGIVTRTDFVRSFARSDQEIRQEIEREIILGTLYCPPGRVDVRVSQGEVTLRGRLDTELDADLLPRLVRRVPGVVSVTADLSWAYDNQVHA
jgi:CBS domain-containing protein